MMLYCIEKVVLGGLCQPLDPSIGSGLETRQIQAIHLEESDELRDGVLVVDYVHRLRGDGQSHVCRDSQRRGLKVHTEDLDVMEVSDWSLLSGDPYF